MKEARGKKYLTHRGTRKRIIVFLRKPSKEEEKSEIFKVSKEKKYPQPDSISKEIIPQSKKEIDSSQTNKK